MGQKAPLEFPQGGAPGRASELHINPDFDPRDWAKKR